MLSISKLQVNGSKFIIFVFRSSFSLRIKSTFVVPFDPFSLLDQGFVSIILQGFYIFSSFLFVLLLDDLVGFFLGDLGELKDFLLAFECVDIVIVVLEREELLFDNFDLLGLVEGVVLRIEVGKFIVGKNGLDADVGDHLSQGEVHIEWIFYIFFRFWGLAHTLARLMF